MEHVLHARCIRCGHLTKNPPADLTVCPVCGGLHEIEYDYDAIRRTTTRESLDRSCDRTMWRFRALLPVKKDSKPTPLRVGGTPVYEEALRGLPRMRHSVTRPILNRSTMPRTGGWIATRWNVSLLERDFIECGFHAVDAYVAVDAEGRREDVREVLPESGHSSSRP